MLIYRIHKSPKICYICRDGSTSEDFIVIKVGILLCVLLIF